LPEASARIVPSLASVLVCTKAPWPAADVAADVAGEAAEAAVVVGPLDVLEELPQATRTNDAAAPMMP